MTSTTFFSGSSSSSSIAGKRFAPASPLVSKAMAGAQAAHQASRALISALSAYPWMTRAMFAGMSPRARRLLRAAY